MKFDVISREINWAGRTLRLETGKIARQADGAVMVSYGDTVVLCTVVADKNTATQNDFFPLTVHYTEKTFSAGRIPGGFFKREGRPSEKEVLTSRLIDRPIRPLFESWYNQDTQVLCTVLSFDESVDADIAAMIGASAALAVSGLPFLGPIGAARVGYVNNEFVLNPGIKDLEHSALDLCVAGTDEGVLMVESEAKELSETLMLQAVMFGFDAFQPVIALIKDFAAARQKAPLFTAPDAKKALIDDKAAKALTASFKSAYAIKVKQDRRAALDAVYAGVKQQWADHESLGTIIDEAKDLEKDLVRRTILETGVRIDDRKGEDIRSIVCETAFLPRVHGSALFTRGETQAIVAATLGTGDDEQIMDALHGEYREDFLLHYNFPPFSVGETGRYGAPGRREIGHGKLAWRALHPMLPKKEDFPYTLRVVSEVTESNGSSSMATVCGASLSLLDAGVPLKRSVAGIAMGLIKEGKDVAILSDILGDEDHLGDMDFKVAGTSEGITALQMDIKITSITRDIMEKALKQAQAGRMHILGIMNQSLSAHKQEVSPWAPRMHQMTIPVDKIRELIGPGGKNIREICDTTKAKIDIKDDGTVFIASNNAEALNAAIEKVKMSTGSLEIGAVYSGKVAKLMDFGAFVTIGNQDGLVHVSEIADERVNNVADYLSVGQIINVKVVGIDERGKIRLSMKKAVA
ncbi:MAG: polyribonucleotide nucleotidyltransferase [Alphaproteobacteria bacterium]